MSLLKEVIGAFTNDGVPIEDIKDDPAYSKAKLIEEAYTAGVDTLRTLFPEPLKGLSADLWDVVGKKHVCVAMGPPVPTLSFAAMPNNPGVRALILVPVNWLAMLQSNATFQLGGIVMTGSQAVDFYNGRFELEASSVIQARAWAYEAEYLRALALPQPNDYQQRTMAAYPVFPPDLLYDRKPVEDPS